MNQSQLVQSTKENDISFNHGSNLRRIANQRMSAMSNYEPVQSSNDARGSQQFVNANQIGSQIIRQGKGKARQVSNIKDGYKSAEKKGGDLSTNTSFNASKNNTQIIAKSFQEGKINFPKPQVN